MDEVDLTILSTLRGNGRATYAELGRQVGLSAPSVHDRVGKLEAAGVIAGYHARVAPDEVGLAVSALVGIFLSDDSDSDAVVQALRAMPAIEDCWFVAGEEAFLIKVRVPDVDALEKTIGQLRGVRGIARTRTTVVLSTRWEGRAGPLPGLPAVPAGGPS